jgi:antitoxin FitA
MATITVKNIPDDLYANLKQSAAANHRSINGEVISCIERSVSNRSRDPEAILERARQLREKWRGPPITDEELQKAKIAGRA